MIDVRMVNLQLHNREEELFCEQEKIISEKGSFVLEHQTKIIKNLITNVCDEDTYKSCVTENWSNFLFGKISAEYIFDQEDLDYYEFLQWFRKINNKYSSNAYIKTLEKYLDNPQHLDHYLKLLDTLINKININMLNDECVWDRYRNIFDNILKEWDKNEIALNVIEKRAYSEDFCWHSSIVFYALYPLRRYNKLGELLEKFKYIYPIQYILSFVEIKADIDILCNILISAPIIKNKNESWNKNKVVLLAIRAINDYMKNLYKIHNYNKENAKNEVAIIISKIIGILDNRIDGNFILQTWLLHLTQYICSLNTNYQDLDLMLIELISKHIKNNKIFRKELFVQNQNISSIRLLVILILISPDYTFPQKYLDLFVNYLTNLNNKIFTGGYKNDPIQIEHRIVAQLFYMPNAINKWKKMWNRLYEERRLACYAQFNKIDYFIEHSLYLILIGLATCEYYFYEDSDIANKFLDLIWECIFEIYLDSPIEISKDIIITSISRILIMQFRLGNDISRKVELIQGNASLILEVVNHLLNNNVDICFIKNNEIIISKIRFALMLNKKDAVSEQYYQKIEQFLISV